MIGLVGGWTVAVLAATGLSWTAVGLAGERVSPVGPSALSQAEVQRRIRAATGSAANTTPPITSTPSSSGSTGAVAAPGQRTVVTPGGTVVLSCTGNVLQARSSPQPGYRIGQESEDGRSSITVTFTNGSRGWEVHGSCRDGEPSAESAQKAAGD